MELLIYAQRLAFFALSGLIVVAASTEVRAEYKDPLDTPSIASQLSSTTQLMAAALAGSRLVAVGWRGHIIYSDDQGKNWTQANVPVSVDLTALDFPTATEGWAVGHGGVILHSLDAGKSWNKVTDGRAIAKDMVEYYETRTHNGDRNSARLLENIKLSWAKGPEQPWLGVQFTSPERGYVVGPFNLIMETLDSGKNWTPILEQLDNPDSLHLNAVTVLDGTLFIPSERGQIFRRAPNEKLFTRVSTGYAGTFFGVCKVSKEMFAYGLRGTVYRSHDDGMSWKKMDTGANSTLNACVPIDNERVVMVSQHGQILTTVPDEERLKSSLLASQTPLFGVILNKNKELFVIGAEGVKVMPCRISADHGYVPGKAVPPMRSALK